MSFIRKGDDDAKPDVPGHIRGVFMGNAPGNFAKQDGHEPDGTVTARKSTGINASSREPIDPRMPNLPPA